MVAASLAVLARGGAFVEVGKRSIWSPARVAQERPDVAHRLVAIDFWPPSAVAASLSHLSSQLVQGALRRSLRLPQLALRLTALPRLCGLSVCC